MATAKPKPPSLFERYEGGRMRSHKPWKPAMRDYGRLLDTAKGFRSAAARFDESSYACLAVGCWILSPEQVQRLLIQGAEELEREVAERRAAVKSTDGMSGGWEL